MRAVGNGLAGVVVGFALFGPIPSAMGQTREFVDSVLTFHPTYLQASVDLYSAFWDVEDVSILVLGKAQGGRPPLEDFPIEGPNLEITFAVTDLQYVRWVLWDADDYGGLSYEFEDGWIRIFADDSPDADLADPATYQDGEVLLEGRMTAYYTGMQLCYLCSTVAGGSVVFTGGSLFPAVSRDGIGFEGVVVHGQTPTDEPFLSLGYQSQGDGSLGLYLPVATRPTTWGRIKSLYTSP